ncbi:ATP-grasp domain-containing protein [Granulicella cerasi]|uniref:ATP-grasp domain-containing protein n=1 Tax=Granulicella cerasi TaxID=741063 RepID=A0ABW1ZFP5_9BACT|nr:ATP-grasp domain-containing protein [Granulicella cerasi]
MGNKPRTLLVASREWVSTARLALALTALGCEVGLVAPARHPAVLAGLALRVFRYHELIAERCLADAIRSFAPDALLACDEHALAAALALAGRDETVSALMRRSFGGEDAVLAASSRLAMAQAAEAAHVSVPRTVAVKNAASVEHAAEELGLPLVLKADESFGGQGVRIVKTLEQARTAWRRLHGTPTVLRAVKRGFVNREWNLMRARRAGMGREVCAQQYVGEPTGELTAAAVAANGALVACTIFAVEHVQNSLAASSVVRVVENAEAVAMLRAMVERLHLSGFVGGDFLPDAQGRLQMLEMNFRATQLVHLPLGAGHDLCAAYVREVLGLAVEDRPAATMLDRIAVFPQEMLRDASSEALQSERAFHDVPWESPALLHVLSKRYKLRL